MAKSATTTTWKEGSRQREGTPFRKLLDHGQLGTFWMACISGVAIPLVKAFYGVIAEDISNRAAIKVRHMDRDPGYRDRVWRETEGMNWELGLQDKLFPGSQE